MKGNVKVLEAHAEVIGVAEATGEVGISGAVAELREETGQGCREGCLKGGLWSSAPRLRNDVQTAIVPSIAIDKRGIVRAGAAL